MTTEQAILDLTRSVGELSAKVGSIGDTVKYSDSKSDAWRANVHRRLDDAIDRIGEIENAVERIGDRLVQIETRNKEDVMPVVDKVNAWEQRGVGALFAAGIACSALGALLVTFWSDFIARITRTG